MADNSRMNGAAAANSDDPLLELARLVAGDDGATENAASEYQDRYSEMIFPEAAPKEEQEETFVEEVAVANEEKIATDFSDDLTVFDDETSAEAEAQAAIDAIRREEAQLAVEAELAQPATISEYAAPELGEVDLQSGAGVPVFEDDADVLADNAAYAASEAYSEVPSDQTAVDQMAVDPIAAQASLGAEVDAQTVQPPLDFGAMEAEMQMNAAEPAQMPQAELQLESATPIDDGMLDFEAAIAGNQPPVAPQMDAAHQQPHLDPQIPASTMQAGATVEPTVGDDEFANAFENEMNEDEHPLLSLDDEFARSMAAAPEVGNPYGGRPPMPPVGAPPPMATPHAMPPQHQVPNASSVVAELPPELLEADPPAPEPQSTLDTIAATMVGAGVGAGAATAAVAAAKTGFAAEAPTAEQTVDPIQIAPEAVPPMDYAAEAVAQQTMAQQTAPAIDPHTLAPQPTGLEDNLAASFQESVGEALPELGQQHEPVHADMGQPQAGFEQPHVGDYGEAPAIPTGAIASDMGRVVRRRRGNAGKIAASVLGIGLLAGAGLIGWNYYEATKDKSTVVVSAGNDPVRIKPTEPGGKTIPNQEQAVYNKVGGEDSDTNQAQLQNGSEEPIARVDREEAVALNTNNGEVSPGLSAGTSLLDQVGKSAERIPVATGTRDTATTANEATITPRKVRTVVVKPDGTILETDAPAASTATTASNESTATTNGGAVFKAPTTSGEGEKVALSNDASPAPALVKPSVVKPNVVKVQPIEGDNQIVSITPKVEDVVTPTAVEETVPAAVEVKPVAKPAAAPKVAETPKPAAVKPKPVAKKEPAPKPVKVATASGPWTMQISSQTSAEAARRSYQNFAKRFPSILGGRSVDIQRGVAKGKTVYRVRIPAGSKSAASSLCSRYTSAGGACYITK